MRMRPQQGHPLPNVSKWGSATLVAMPVASAASFSRWPSQHAKHSLTAHLATVGKTAITVYTSEILQAWGKILKG